MTLVMRMAMVALRSMGCGAAAMAPMMVGGGGLAGVLMRRGPMSMMRDVTMMRDVGVSDRARGRAMMVSSRRRAVGRRMVMAVMRCRRRRRLGGG
ncbi:MAG: hypothetical protein JO111_05515 [Caulobacteraceae bacterium]|nr:hypothetical protein [Caulobacteraceae bacterium]